MISDITVPFEFHAGSVALPTEVNANNSVFKTKISELVAALNGITDGVPEMWATGGAYSAGVTVWSPTDFKTYRAKTEMSESTMDPHDEYLDTATDWDLQSYSKDADTTDSFHASQTPAAGKIPALNAFGILDLLLGGGIKFGNATPSDTKVLNWFEKGNISYTLVGTTVAGTTTYDNRAGKYTRIGNVVICTMGLNLSAKSGTGAVKITGLPFVPADYFTGALAFLNITGFGGAGTFTPKSLAMYGTTGNYLNVSVTDLDSGAFTFLDMANIGADFQAYGTFIYLAA